MIGHPARKMRGGGYRCLRSRLMPRYIYTSSLHLLLLACLVTKTCNKEGLRMIALLWIEVQVGSRMWAASRSRWWPFTLCHPMSHPPPLPLPPHPLLVRTGSPDFLQISCSACLLRLQFLQTHVAKRRDWCKVCSNEGSTASRDLLGQAAWGGCWCRPLARAGASGRSRGTRGRDR